MTQNSKSDTRFTLKRRTEASNEASVRPADDHTLWVWSSFSRVVYQPFLPKT